MNGRVRGKETRKKVLVFQPGPVGHVRTLDFSLNMMGSHCRIESKAINNYIYDRKTPSTEGVLCLGCIQMVELRQTVHLKVSIRFWCISKMKGHCCLNYEQ